MRRAFWKTRRRKIKQFFSIDASTGTVLNFDEKINFVISAQSGVILKKTRTHVLIRRETKKTRMFLIWHDTFTHARWIIMKKKTTMTARENNDKRVIGEKHTKWSKMKTKKNFGHDFGLQEIKFRLKIENFSEPDGGCVEKNNHDFHWITNKTQYYKFFFAKITKHAKRNNWSDYDKMNQIRCRWKLNMNQNSTARRL